MSVDIASQHSLEWSSPRSEIVKALFEFQKKRQRIPRTRTAHVKTDRADFQYRYFNLEDVQEAADPILEELGLLVIQGTEASATDPKETLMMVTEIHHVESGEYVRSYRPFPLEMINPQRSGGWETYVRRFAVSTLLGYAGEDMDEDIGELAAAELAKTRNRVTPIIDKCLKNPDEKAEDTLLEEVDKLSPWQYDVVWKDLNTKQKAKVREMLHSARMRKGGQQINGETSQKDKRRMEVRGEL